jgi:hypothetical protein
LLPSTFKELGNVFLKPKLKIVSYIETKSMKHSPGFQKMQAQSRHTEWQRPLSVVHSIMMEKLAQAGEGGEGARQPPFITITYKVAVYGPAERADICTPLI